MDADSDRIRVRPAFEINDVATSISSDTWRLGSRMDIGLNEERHNKHVRRENETTVKLLSMNDGNPPRSTATRPRPPPGASCHRDNPDSGRSQPQPTSKHASRTQAEDLLSYRSLRTLIPILPQNRWKSQPHAHGDVTTENSGNQGANGADCQDWKCDEKRIPPRDQAELVSMRCPPPQSPSAE